MGDKCSKWQFFGINMLIAVILIILILIFIIIGTRKYTRHGQEIEVPQITGLYPHEAEFLLTNSGLQLEIIDSTFSQKVPLGTIVEQTPVAESKVKPDRTIYVIINANSKRHVLLPELHDVSYRQAENILLRLGLVIDSIAFEPSEYKDLVLDIRQGSQSVETGTKLVEGTSVVLVVGQGRGTEMMSVPDLCGLNLTEARSTLLNQHLTMGAIAYDVPPTEDNRDTYIVYMQDPQSGATLLEGSSVQVKMSQNREKAVTAENEEDEEEFF